MKKSRLILSVMAVLCLFIGIWLIVAQMTLKKDEKIMVLGIDGRAIAVIMFLIVPLLLLFSCIALLAERKKEGKSGKGLAITGIVIFSLLTLIPWGIFIWALSDPGTHTEDLLARKVKSPDGKYEVYCIAEKSFGVKFYNFYRKKSAFTYEYLFVECEPVYIQWDEDCVVHDGQEYKVS
ncbi:MAG: hypothetical protein IKH78_07995 [Ruminococcus sp.]|nr:hypothetical protein [Ruminococcus sp.]